MCSPTQRLPKSHLLGFLWSLPHASMVKYLLHFQPLFPLWRIRGGAKSGLVFLMTSSTQEPTKTHLIKAKATPPRLYTRNSKEYRHSELEPGQRSLSLFLSLYIYTYIIISVWHLHCAHLCKITFINIGTPWFP